MPHDHDALRRELDAKERHVRDLMIRRGLDVLVLRKVSSFAWATGGVASYVNVACDVGEAAVVYDDSGRFVTTNAIEAPRLESEGALASLGFRCIARPWMELDALDVAANGRRVGADAGRHGETDVGSDVACLRATLGAREIADLEETCRRAAEAMTEALDRVAPGQTELAIAAEVSRALRRRDVLPTVLQVATDERIHAFRHALPTTRVLERHLMVSFCGRRNGLVCSTTRLVHFGAIDRALALREEAVARVDAAMLAAARIGRTLGEVFRAAMDAYTREGFPGEWLRHHQGGLVGYEPRERLALPDDGTILTADHVLALNPTVAGCKSEDTCALGASGVRVLTEMKGWPVFVIEVGGHAFARPRIQVR